MRAACRTFCPSTAPRWTRLDALSFPRNEGVPGSSPGVGSGERRWKRRLSQSRRAVANRGQCSGWQRRWQRGDLIRPFELVFAIAGSPSSYEPANSQKCRFL